MDRRSFMHSMIALGASTGLRPIDIFAMPPAGELADLADAALASAKKAGASYADIRINRYRVQFIFTRDRRVQNIVNTEDYGFGVRVIVDGTWGFASSSQVTKEEIARVVGAGRGDCARQPAHQHRADHAGAGRGLQAPPGTRRWRRTRSTSRFSRSSICCCRSTRKR